MAILGTARRSADHDLTGRPAGGWCDVALPRLNRSALAFNGTLVCCHRRDFNAHVTLELSLWRRRLTGLVISYPVCTADGITGDAVLVDSVDEAMRYLEDLCAFPPPHDPPSGTLLEGLLQVQRGAQFHQAFSTLVGEALADWSALDPTPGTLMPPQQARP